MRTRFANIGLSIALGAIALGISPETVSAQENVVLPDLAPRVVEIRGELTISFPSLSRQPLVGFNPPPRVPEIPRGRRPFTEIYKQSKDDLPPSPLRRPEPPEASTTVHRSPVQGIAEFGVGRYLERYLRANLSAPMSRRTTLILNGQYSGTNGYEPFPTDPTIQTAADAQSISAGIRHILDRFRTGFSVGLMRSAYSLFGARAIASAPTTTNPDRTLTGWNATAWLATAPGSRISAKLSLLADHTVFKTDLFDPNLRQNPTLDRTEDHLLMKGTIETPLNEGRASIDGHLSFQGLDTDGFPGRTVSSGSVAGSYEFQASERVSVNAGLRLLGFDALGQAAGGADRSILFLSPDVDVNYSLRPGAWLSFSNKPEVSTASMRDVYISAPFIEDFPAIQPVLTPVHLKSSLHVATEFVQADAGIGWKDVKNYRYIESLPVAMNGFAEGFLAVDYGEASILYLDGQVAASLAPGIQASAQIAFRRGRLDNAPGNIPDKISDKNAESVIPYFSPITTGASLSVALLEGDVLLKLLLRGESARYRDRAETSRVGSIVLIDVEGAWYVTPQVGAVVGVRNLGGAAEFWDNYEWESSVFYAGARWRW